MILACGCIGEWRTDKMAPAATEIRDRPCPCCEAPAGKLCAGASGGNLGETGKHPAVKWMYVCLQRIDAPLQLL